LNKSEKRIHIINTNAWLSSVIYKDHNISFTVEAPINVTSFTKIYCDQYGKPTQINGSMNWDYDEIMKTLTIQTLHRQHSQTITLTWSEIILNSPPIASFNHSPNEPVVFSPVSFNDSSIDPNGSVVSWQWDFGDGGVSSLKNPVHTYRKDGIYTVSLTVFDDKNEINTNYKDITINNISFVDRNLQRITSIVGILLFVILILYLYARARARRPG
jgi:PKD repeat protein